MTTPTPTVSNELKTVLRAVKLGRCWTRRWAPPTTWPAVRSATRAVDGVCVLRGAPRRRRRSSSTDVPGNVPGSHGCTWVPGARWAP